MGDEEPPEQVTLTIEPADIELYEEQDATPEPDEEEVEAVLG